MKQTKKVGKYHIMLTHPLGSGSFSKAYKSYKDRDKSIIFACKVINKEYMKQICQDTEYIIGRVRDQFKVLKNLKHDKIIKFEDSQQTTNNLYLFFQYCQNGTLQDYINRHKFQHHQQEQFDLITQVIDGCEYLEQKGVLHRDIKPQNILFTKNCIKIADFGLAKILDKDDSYRVTMVGTFSYMAPEILKQSKTKQTKKCDVWSVGITIYEILTGYLPFELTQKMKSPHLILSKLEKYQNITFEQIKNPLMRSLVSKMLVLDVNKRITFKEAKQFISQFNNNSLINRLQQMKIK